MLLLSNCRAYVSESMFVFPPRIQPSAQSVSGRFVSFLTAELEPSTTRHRQRYRILVRLRCIFLVKANPSPSWKRSCTHHRNSSQGRRSSSLRGGGQGPLGAFAYKRKYLICVNLLLMAHRTLKFPDGTYVRTDYCFKRIPFSMLQENPTQYT